MTLKLRAVTLISASALLLAGCSSSPSGTDGGDNAASGGLVGTGSGESCVIDTPIKVGAALSLTGAAGSYGEAQQKGLELALKQLNEVGGVTYDLTIEDDQTDPRQGISVFEGFVADGTSAMIGPTLSDTAFKAMPIAQEAGVPVLGISNTATGITAQGDYVFRVSLTEQQVIPNTIAQATESLGLKSAVLMYSNDDDFTASGFDVMKAALEEQGVEVLDILTFSKADTDFRSLLTTAKGLNSDALVVSALIEAAIPLVTQARELGIDGPIIGGNGFNNPKLMSDGGDAAEGVIVGAAWNSASQVPENLDFMADFEAEYGSLPDQFATQAYAGLQVIDYAVRANCSGERDDVQDGLTKVADLATPLGAVTINSDRDADHAAVVQVVENGKFAVLN